MTVKGASIIAQRLRQSGDIEAADMMDLLIKRLSDSNKIVHKRAGGR